MKKLSLAMLTIILVILLVSPAAAAINYQVNGKTYQPVKAPENLGGTTMISATFLQRTIGADISTSGNKITIKSNSDVLELTVGSKTATLNGQAFSLPQAPNKANGQLMIPLRGTLDKLGANMTWQGSQQTINIINNEQQDGMTAEQILVKSNEALAKYNSYKMKATATQDATMISSDLPQGSIKMKSNIDMDVAAQIKPMQVFAKYKVSSLAAGEKLDLNAQMLFNENGMFMDMGDAQWIKMSLPGLDMKAIMEQAGGDDPLAYMKQMKEAGVILSLGNQTKKNGRDCWVVNMTMGKDALSNLLKKALQGMPPSAAGGGDFNSLLQETMKNMKGEIALTYYVDKESCLPAFNTLDMKMQINMDVPSTNPGGKGSKMSMNMDQKADFEIYGWGETFTVPDVSQAKEMTLPGN